MTTSKMQKSVLIEQQQQQQNGRLSGFL